MVSYSVNKKSDFQPEFQLVYCSALSKTCRDEVDVFDGSETCGGGRDLRDDPELRRGRPADPSCSCRRHIKEQHIDEYHINEK